MEPLIWSTVLDHICIQTSAPKAMRDFYRDALAMQEIRLNKTSWLLEGADRRLILSEGISKTIDYSGFRVLNDNQLICLRRYIEAKSGGIIENPSPLFEQGAFGVVDPDGNKVSFGVTSSNSLEAAGLDGRLQHVVVASPRLNKMIDYYQTVLGFLPSDHVLQEDGEITAAFYRSDPEHHTFAVFAAAEKAFDHMAFETPSWNHIRDWADHLASFDIPIWWGPGRHGVGNNLFFMILDPDGNKVEFSAELERLDSNHPVRYWSHDRRTLNLWGNAWMRD
jgi:catechol 2,3-dioxygenase-like lactoylglutathione lyase family enzyme